MSVIDPDHLSHILLVGHLDHDAVGRRLDDSSMFGCDIDPFVKFPLIALPKGEARRPNSDVTQPMTGQREGVAARSDFFSFRKASRAAKLCSRERCLIHEAIHLPSDPVDHCLFIGGHLRAQPVLFAHRTADPEELLLVAARFQIRHDSDLLIELFELLHLGSKLINLR